MCRKKVQSTTFSGKVPLSKQKSNPGDLLIRTHLVNLIVDGALPSPILSLCCTDKTCYACYLALEILVEKNTGRKLCSDDCIALSAYTGRQINIEESNGNMESEQEQEQQNRHCYSADEIRRYCGIMMDRVLQSWRTSIPPRKLNSSCVLLNVSLKRKKSIMRKSAVHNDECVHCRGRYESLYQEFSLFVYPQEGSELGIPAFHDQGVVSSLSDGTALTRIFNLYLYGSSESILSDMALLEMVDPRLTSICDHKKLLSNGFIHEIDANGATYWARGTLFHDIYLESRCTIRAALVVRMLAVNSINQTGEVVRCAKTIAKWLEIMGLEKNGFKMCR